MLLIAGVATLHWNIDPVRGTLTQYDHKYKSKKKQFDILT